MAWTEGQNDTLLDVGIQEPKSYQVVMLNDETTTQEFVTEVLVEIFHKNQEEAVQIMLKIHNDGRSIVGVYPYDLAVSKVKKTIARARNAEYPLQCVIQEV